MHVTSARATPRLDLPAGRVTGRAVARMIHVPPESSTVRAMTVELGPGARTAWHAHPYGQVLVAVSGRGRVCAEGGPVVELLPGDAVWAEPGERHWHGAAPGEPFVYTSVQAADPVTGSYADWGEPVGDADYAVSPVDAASAARTA